MLIRSFLAAAALATMTALAAAAPAPSADEDCDDIMGELKELADTVMAEKSNAKTPVATCAAWGQILGVAKASREVADECYDEGKKRDDLVAALEAAVKQAEAQVGGSCK